MTAQTLPRPEQVQGHRGASRIAPENTIAAFRAAADQGARWVEFDVALLGDGTPVVMHDETFARCAGIDKHLRDATLADLDTINAGLRMGGRYGGERVPTVDQTLVALAEAGLSANLEIKRHAYQTALEPLVDAVHHALAHRPDGLKVAISSFDLEALRLMRARDAEIELAVLWSELPADWLDVVRSIPAQAVHLNYRALTPKMLAEAQAHDIRVRVWTCNDPTEISAFWPLGLDAVITDDPSLFIPR